MRLKRSLELTQMGTAVQPSRPITLPVERQRDLTAALADLATFNARPLTARADLRYPKEEVEDASKLTIELLKRRGSCLYSSILSRSGRPQSGEPTPSITVWPITLGNLDFVGARSLMMIGDQAPAKWSGLDSSVFVAEVCSGEVGLYSASKHRAWRATAGTGTI